MIPHARLIVSPVTHAATGSAKLIKVASFRHLNDARIRCVDEEDVARGNVALTKRILSAAMRTEDVDAYVATKDAVRIIFVTSTNAPATFGLITTLASNQDFST